MNTIRTALEAALLGLMPHATPRHKAEATTAIHACLRMPGTLSAAPHALGFALALEQVRVLATLATGADEGPDPQRRARLVFEEIERIAGRVLDDWVDGTPGKALLADIEAVAKS